jgi:hypothetical protein
MESFNQILNEYSGLISLVAAIAAIASYIVAKRSEINTKKSKQAELDAINEFEDGPFAGFLKGQPDYETQIRKRQLEKELKK